MPGSQCDRRSFLAGGVAALAAARFGAPALAATNRKTFPRGFRWGAATAAHQVEGSNVNSDLWLMENIEPRTFADRSGDACDSYHRFDEDLALIRQIGLNSYRFSIEWARIEPIQGRFSDHEAIGNGVPVIGYCHWSLMDNFEWQRGYGPKYGLASVDGNTFRRTLKPSAAVYSRIVRSNAL